MPEIPLSPEDLRRQMAVYRTESEKAIRDLQALGREDATCPSVNAFFRDALSGRKFERAADLGCNNGSFSLEVLAPVAGKLTLADFSRAALEMAQSRLPSGKVEQALALDLTRDFPRLPPFDLISLCEVIQHMPVAGDRERVFAGAAALLKPGGTLLFSTYRLEEGAAREGFFGSDRFEHRLYFWRSTEAENLERFRQNRLEILGRFREARVDAFILRRST